MLEGQNIICFSKDWSQDPTCNNHVMRILSQKNNVIWINYIIRKPNLASGRDLHKIARALARFFKGPTRVTDNLYVFSPLVLPLPHSRLAASINQRILTLALARLRRRLRIDRFQLWSFLPSAAPYIGKLGESLTVYYCTDDFSQFSFVDGAGMAAADEQLCRRADVVFATARNLHEKRLPLNPETHLALHGVDHQHFASALAPETAIPPDLASHGNPILGFFGWIHDWIDLDLIASLAERRPDWTIALIGKASVDVTRLQRHPNIRLLGQRPYSQLPGYCKAFSVALLPFVVNELTKGVNPIKLREYLSAGLPVVSTDLPEVSSYRDGCSIARSGDEFVAACERAIAADSPARRQARSQAMAAETWEARVSEIGDIVHEVARRRDTTAA
jgi:glycosyltransferase involved in cell wall biosynthesis